MDRIIIKRSLPKEWNSRKCHEDRITNLPSSLKTKILSCLPTNEAVKTSILSTKWKRMWTSITNLDFDDDLVGFSRFHDEEDIISTKDFTSFVNRVLLLRDRSNLQRFSMRCKSDIKGPLVNAWIAAVLLCNVQEFNLFVSIEYPSLLPSDIFLCKTLMVLKLETEGRVNMPTSVCLPRLKTLHLAKIKLSDDVSINGLLSGCPVLEDLSLRQCIGTDVTLINVIAPALTNLILEDLPYDEEAPYSDYKYEIVLNTPALQFLNFSDHAAKGYVVKNLYHLMKAVITVGAPDEEENAEFILNRCKAIEDFLKGISQTRSLVLSSESMLAIHSCDSALPIFSYLTYMELSTIFSECPFLPKLVENSPCLETLYLWNSPCR